MSIKYYILRKNHTIIKTYLNTSFGMMIMMTLDRYV